MKYKGKRYLSGYMTVEASLVMATVLIVYLFILRIMLFQYDRCLLEQEVACMAVRYADVNPETLEETTGQVQLKWDAKQYLLLKPQAPMWEVKGGYVIINAQDNKDVLDDVQYKLWQTKPESLLRIQRKILKSQEKKEGSD